MKQQRDLSLVSVGCVCGFVLLFGLGINAAIAAPPVTLRWRIAAGDTLYYKIESTALPQLSSVSVQLFARPDGHFQMEMFGRHLENQPQSIGPASRDAIRQMGTQPAPTHNSRSELVAVIVFDSTNQLLTNWVKPQYQVWASLFYSLPQQPVVTGKYWPANLSLLSLNFPVNPSQITYLNRVTFQQTEGNLAVLKLDYDEQVSGTAITAAGGQSASSASGSGLFYAQAKFSGTIRFDYRNGYLADFEGFINVAFNMSLPGTEPMQGPYRITRLTAKPAEISHQPEQNQAPTSNVPNSSGESSNDLSPGPQRIEPVPRR